MTLASAPRKGDLLSSLEITNATHSLVRSGDNNDKLAFSPFSFVVSCLEGCSVVGGEKKYLYH